MFPSLPLDQNITHDNSWISLANVAITGLRTTYQSGTLPYTRLWDGRIARRQGLSIRYGLISLIGLAKAPPFLGANADIITSLWEKLQIAIRLNKLRPGDFGLGLWAQVLCNRDAGPFSPQKALKVFQIHMKNCDSVELSWLILGAEAAINFGWCNGAEELAEIGTATLLRLYNHRARLFYRHDRPGIASSVSRRISCFANQIYPIMALSVHGFRTGERNAIEVAVDVAEKLCRLQGKLGQWWWLYDARDGRVVDGYPVFSVHQHGMAPIGLYEVERVSGKSFTTAIDRGLEWVWGRNELLKYMVIPGEGLIPREIHRKGSGRLGRMLRGLLCCLGWKSNAHEASRSQFEVNLECRPYELGWLLCASGLITGKGDATVCSK